MELGPDYTCHMFEVDAFALDFLYSLASINANGVYTCITIQKIHIRLYVHTCFLHDLKLH